jgi:hypothetical protein
MYPIGGRSANQRFLAEPPQQPWCNQSADFLRTEILKNKLVDVYIMPLKLSARLFIHAFSTHLHVVSLVRMPLTLPGLSPSFHSDHREPFSKARAALLPSR